MGPLIIIRNFSRCCSAKMHEMTHFAKDFFNINSCEWRLCALDLLHSRQCQMLKWHELTNELFYPQTVATLWTYCELMKPVQQGFCRRTVSRTSTNLKWSLTLYICVEYDDWQLVRNFYSRTHFNIFFIIVVHKTLRILGLLICWFLI